MSRREGKRLLKQIDRGIIAARKNKIRRIATGYAILTNIDDARIALLTEERRQVAATMPAARTRRRAVVASA